MKTWIFMSWGSGISFKERVKDSENRRLFRTLGFEQKKEIKKNNIWKYFCDTWPSLNLE